MELALFSVAALVAVISAALVIINRHPVYSALYLILTLCALGFLYLLLGAQFIAMVQVIVYAGAIMVLFLFVIMLLNLDRPLETESKLKHQRWVGVTLAAVLLLEMFYLLVQGRLGAFAQPPPRPGADFGLTQTIAQTLFNEFAFAFEATSIVLLVAMIGVIVLAKRLRDVEGATAAPRRAAPARGETRERESVGTRKSE